MKGLMRFFVVLPAALAITLAPALLEKTYAADYSSGAVTGSSDMNSSTTTTTRGSDVTGAPGGAAPGSGAPGESVNNTQTFSGTSGPAVGGTTRGAMGGTVDNAYKSGYQNGFTDGFQGLPMSAAPSDMGTTRGAAPSSNGKVLGGYSQRQLPGQPGGGAPGFSAPGGSTGGIGGTGETFPGNKSRGNASDMSATRGSSSLSGTPDDAYKSGYSDGYNDGLQAKHLSLGAESGTTRGAMNWSAPTGNPAIDAYKQGFREGFTMRSNISPVSPESRPSPGSTSGSMNNESTRGGSTGKNSNY